MPHYVLDFIASSCTSNTTSLYEDDEILYYATSSPVSKKMNVWRCDQGLGGESAITAFMNYTNSTSLTCRQRKLKCDETKPICSNCRKGSRECRLSDGVVFRHQQNASMNGEGEVVEGNGQKLGAFYAYKNTFNEDNVWVDVPKRGRNKHLEEEHALSEL